MTSAKTRQILRADLIDDLSPTQTIEDAAEVSFSTERIEEMRAEVRRRLARMRRNRRTIVPDPPPRYDAVFAAGTAWLDGEEESAE